MVKITLQIKADVENLDEVYTNHPNYTFLMKMKCSNCGEVSDKWQHVTESEKFPGRTGRSETHLSSKCKLCMRENSLDIIEGSNGKYTTEDFGKFKSIVTFDCRGIEPVEFQPGSGWIAKVEESGKMFNDIDLTEKDWSEFDDKLQQPVSIFQLESRFVKIK